MHSQDILEFLDQEGAVLTNSHFIYTSGLHGTAYINMRAVAHQGWWLIKVGREMARVISARKIDLVLGPETLGRTLAGYAARGALTGEAIWCDFDEDENGKFVRFNPKLDFGRLVKGKRVAITDDLLTTGSSIRQAAELVSLSGGVPVLGVAVVRRTPDVTAEHCGVQELCVLADVPGFQTFSEAECQASGPCSQQVPVVLRPGHGHEWIKGHPGYPTA